jgi:hypothetical protein
MVTSSQNNRVHEYYLHNTSLMIVAATAHHFCICVSAIDLLLRIILHLFFQCLWLLFTLAHFIDVLLNYRTGCEIVCNASAEEVMIAFEEASAADYCEAAKVSVTYALHHIVDSH